MLASKPGGRGNSASLRSNRKKISLDSKVSAILIKAFKHLSDALQSNTKEKQQQHKLIFTLHSDL